MSQPETARERWADLISRPHTPPQWAAIAAAIRAADASPDTDDFASRHRGDEAWCHAAMTALETPIRASSSPDTLPSRCFADADLIRTWLTAPTADAAQTVGDGLDLVDWSRASIEAAHRSVVDLIEQAQDAGVFGVGSHHLEVHRLVDADSQHAGYLLVIRPELGPGLASSELFDEDLIPTSESSIVDGAVRVLLNAATIMDVALERRDAAQTLSTAERHRPRGHAFRANPTADGPSQPPADPPTPTSRPNRTR